MKILICIAACVTLAFFAEHVLAKDCYSHAEVEGSVTVSSSSDTKKCSQQNNSACLILYMHKETTKTDGTKEKVATTLRDCETSKDDNCIEYSKRYEARDGYSDIKCYSCHPNKCNADSDPKKNSELKLVGASAVPVLSILFKALPVVIVAILSWQ